MISHSFSRPLKRVPWMLCAVLALMLGFGLTAAQVRETIAPGLPAGVHSPLRWASISNGEINKNIGFRQFAKVQVEFLAGAFPDHRLIAATAAAPIEVRVDDEVMQPRIQFIDPQAFVDAGVRVTGRSIGSADAPFCVASERWHQVHGHRQGRLRIGENDLLLSGSVDPRFRMFAGVEAADLWCSWDQVGLFLGAQDGIETAEIPTFWVYVGSADANGERQWRERAAAIDMPNGYSRGFAVKELQTLDAWVGHPVVQQAAVQRLARLQSLAILFVSFGLALTLFIAAQRMRARHHELALRCAIGARKRHLIGPVLHSHLAALVLSLPLGIALAWLLTRLIWLDASLAEARFSGATIWDVPWWPLLALWLGLASLSAALDLLLVLALSKGRLLDVSAKSALLGLGRSRTASAVVVGFAFVALTVLCAQGGGVSPPGGIDYGLPDDLRLLGVHFDSDVGVFERALPGEQLQQIASTIDRSLEGQRFAVVDMYPGYQDAAFPGSLKRQDGEECGSTAELLRGSQGLLSQLSVGFALGTAPIAAGDIALSESRAIRCFGSPERALGAALRKGSERFHVSGIYRDFDWHLGSGARSEFVAGLPKSSLGYFGVLIGAGSPAQASQMFLQQLQAFQGKVIDIIGIDLNERAAQLHQAEVAQARVLSGLGLLLALGCVLASAALFAVVYAELAPTLALHLALGASPVQLGGKALLPMLGIALLVVTLLGALRIGLGERSAVISSVLSAGMANMALAGAMTLMLVGAMAAWRLASVLRRPGLAAELHGA